MSNTVTTEPITINGIEIPPAPPCPDWCQNPSEHTALGWDEIEYPRGPVIIARKMCEQIFLDSELTHMRNQVSHFRAVYFDSADSCGPVVDDRWEINGAEVTPAELRSLVLALTPALANLDE